MLSLININPKRRLFYLILLALISSVFYSLQASAQQPEDLPQPIFLQPNSNSQFSEDKAVLLQTLSSQQQNLFLQKRSQIVNQTQSFLSKIKPLFYIWDVIATQFHALKSEFIFNGEEPSEEIKEMIRQDRLNHPEKYKNLKMAQRVQSTIRKVIEGIDQQLWRQPLLVAQSNEFSFLGALSLQLEMGYGSKGYGGLIELGFNIGYNTEKKSVFFQLFNAREKFKETVMKAIAVAAITPKVGLKIQNGNGLSKSTTEIAESFYPPMIPGFQINSQNSYTFGFSSGVGLPPSPVGDMLTYKNSRAQTNLLRIEYSVLQNRIIDVKTILQKKSHLCQHLF